MFVIILLIVLVIIYYTNSINVDKFTELSFYIGKPYKPDLSTPKTNYNDIIDKINRQNQYKKDLSVALAPTPTIQCDKLSDKESCNQYGCNWFGTFCSSMYPRDF